MVLEIAAASLAFLAVSSLVFGLSRGTSSAVIDRRFARLAVRDEDASQTNAAASEGLLRDPVSTYAPLRRLLAGGEWATGTSRSLARAGVNLRVGEFLILRILSALILASVAALLFSSISGWIFIAMVVAVVGYILPAIWLKMQADRRQRLISRQLAEALQLMANALRSGVAFLQAIKIIVAQVPPPLSVEFEHFLQDTSLGLPTEEALAGMVERSGSVDMDIVVTAIVVQRTAGGRLSEVLDSIADTMRERERLEGEIHSMTSQQRLTATVMSLYPAGLGAFFFLISPTQTSLLWTEEAGRILLAIAILLQVAGIIVMRRVLKLEV